MKKFLTVLLALSVVFTYSFGTVFAAEPVNSEGTFNGNVNEAQQLVLNTFNAAYSNAIASLADTEVNQGGSKLNITKEAWMTIAEEYKADQLTLLYARTNKIKQSYATAATTPQAIFADYTVPQLVELYEKDTTTAGIGFTAAEVPAMTAGAMISGMQADKYKDKAARYQFGVNKTAALAALKGADISMYSTTIQEIGGVETSYRALAQEALDTATTSVSAVVISDTTTATQAAVEMAKIGEAGKSKYTDALKQETVAAAGSGFMAVIENVRDINGEATAAYQFVDTATLKTIAEESGEVVTLEATKAARLADLSQKAASYYAGIVSGGDADAIAAAKELKDAYVKAWTYVINAATSTVPTATALATGHKYVENLKAIEDLEVYAAKYKAEKDLDGNLVRDGKLVDKVVEAAKVVAYQMTTSAFNASSTTVQVPELNSNTATAPETLINQYCNVVSVADFVKSDKVAELEAALKGFVDAETYYDLEQAKVNALYADAIAKVKAATSQTEITKATTDLASAVGKVDAKTAVNSMFAAGGVLYSTFTPEFNKLSAYETFLNSQFNGDTTAAGYRNFDKWNAADEMAAFYAKNNVRTAAEVTAFYDTARAALEAVPTNGELATARAAVEALIAALPAKPTLADKAAVKAAYEARKAYVEDKGFDDIANTNSLTLAIAEVQKADLYAIQVAKANLPTTITVADKAAVKAITAAIEAFNDEDMYGSANADTYAVTTEYQAIRTLELADVKAKINAIPLNVTLADKATVEAARAAVDAFVAEYTDYDNNYNPLDNTNIPLAAQKVLTEAEAAIKVAEADADPFDGLALKATTKKVGKKVRVYFKNVSDEVKALGDNAYIQVWKSKNAVKYNFSKRAKVTAASTLISKTYNGKNYVKYRVVIVNEDGTKTFSAWSTVGCRIIKK